MNTVTVDVPLALTKDMMDAVRKHPITKVKDVESWHTRLGWLICAWDVLLETRPNVGAGQVLVPIEAIEWLMGEKGEFLPADHRDAKPVGYKCPQFWWRSEFKRRAGL